MDTATEASTRAKPVVHSWRQTRASASLYAVALLLALPVTGRAVDYGADVGLATLYTSNLTLAPSGEEQGQWINSIIPAVYLTHVGANFEVDIDYQLQAFFYAGESDLDQAYSDLWATGLLDLIGDEFSLYGLARVTQVNIDPEAPIVDNNFNVTGNRSSGLAWEAGPQWVRYGGNYDIDAFFYGGQVNYDDDALQDVDKLDGMFVIGSANESTQRLSYEFDWRYRNYEYANSGVFKRQLAQLELGYFATTFFQIVGVGGMESNIVVNDGKLDEPFWEAGFRTWIGQNRLEGFYGERYYGPTYRGEWEYLTQKSQFRVSYVEEQVTDEALDFDVLAEDYAAGLDPTVDPSLSPQDGLEQPGTGARSLIRRWRADFRLNFYRSDMHLFAFSYDREQILPDPGQPVDPDEQLSTDESVGAGFNFTWEFGVYTQLELYGNWTNRAFDIQDVNSERKIDLYRGDIRLLYDLGPMTEIIARVGYQGETGSLTGYDEVHAGIEFRQYFIDRR